MKVTIEKLVQEARGKGFELLISENKDNVVSFCRDNYHLFIDLEHFSLQVAIKIEKTRVYCLVFPDPIMVNKHNKRDLIMFINHMNWLTLSLGRFYIDTNNDIAYAIGMPEYMVLNHIEQVRAELFEIPICFFNDMQIPLKKLSIGDWTLDMAIQYVSELYNDGCVCNDNYDI